MNCSIMLSQQSYEILKHIAEQPESATSDFSSLPEECIIQLLDYKFLAASYNNYVDSLPELSSLKVTELGKGYLYGRQSEENFQQSVKDIADSALKAAGSADELAKASEKTSESAKDIADSAVKTANKADIKGWISIGISLASLVWSIIYPFILSMN